jgi:hypothetical protein
VRRSPRTRTRGTRPPPRTATERRRNRDCPPACRGATPVANETPNTTPDIHETFIHTFMTLQTFIPTYATTDKI